MKRTDAFPSSYLKQEDLPRPPGTMHATIEDVRTETMPSDDKAEKPVMYFANGSTKPMVLNGGNWDLLEAAYGEDSDRWRGKPTELSVHPHVMYAGRPTCGIRARIARHGNDPPASGRAYAAPAHRSKEAGIHASRPASTRPRSFTRHSDPSRQL